MDEEESEGRTGGLGKVDMTEHPTAKSVRRLNDKTHLLKMGLASFPPVLHTRCALKTDGTIAGEASSGKTRLRAHYPFGVLFGAGFIVMCVLCSPARCWGGCGLH